MSDIHTIEKLLELPVEERLAIAEALWESLVADPTSVPVPDWHRQIVEERLDEDDTDTMAGETWDNLRRRIEAGE